MSYLESLNGLVPHLGTEPTPISLVSVGSEIISFQFTLEEPQK